MLHLQVRGTAPQSPSSVLLTRCSRDRRIRCDQTRPTCLRCLRSDRTCSGYRSEQHRDKPRTIVARPANEASLAHLSARPAVDCSSKSYPRVLCLITLTCETLRRGSDIRQGLESGYWSGIVPQLCQMNDLVAAAATSLGATLEIRQSSRIGVQSLAPSYLFAVSSIRGALESSQPPSIPLVTACLLLAIADVLVGRDLQALSHLQGAFALLRRRKIDGGLNERVGPDERRCDGRPETEVVFEMLDELDDAAAILDVSVGSFAMMIRPRLPKLCSSRKPGVASTTSSLHDIETEILTALHSVLRFAADYSRYKFIAAACRPPVMEETQQNVISTLLMLLRTLDAFLVSAEELLQAKALILRSQCRSFLIYTASISEPREVSYDRFAKEFASIVAAGERVEAANTRHKLGHRGCALRLTLGLGMAQSLYQAAVKCRDPSLRRRAIKLLTHIGQEGPFDGKMFAAVARRVVEIEEQFKASSPSPMAINQCSSVPEERRIHGSRFHSLPDETLSDPMPSKMVVTFCRRKATADTCSWRQEEEGMESRWSSWSETLSRDT